MSRLDDYTRGYRKGWNDAKAHAAARIEALEATLREIANPSTVAGMHEQDRDRKLQEIARAALAPEQNK